MVGGVAGGLADHLGVDVLWIRVAFVLLVGLGGAGLLMYALLWVCVPPEPVGSVVRPVALRERQQAFGLIALAIAFAVGVSTLAGSVNGWVAAPLVVVLAGAVLVWREADADRRRRWVDGARSGLAGAVFGTGGRMAVWRVLTGVILVIAGIAALLLHSVDLGQIGIGLGAALATLVGVAVLTVPWWLRLARDLGEERRGRIRVEERAAIAAHLHDSVLQTLALIQKRPDNSREVLRLARGQERQLRTWLYGPSGYGLGGPRTVRHGTDGGDGPDGQVPDGSSSPTSLSEAIGAACGQVEDTYVIAARPVVVGDCVLDERLSALVLAAREAMVNAAKHSGASEISVYAEVEPERVTVFVRDRGKGFDPDAVAEDRHGLTDSITARMDRHGGAVTLRTAIGEGTEMRLTMPRVAAGNAPVGRVGEGS